jgi:hypothetical protein
MYEAYLTVYGPDGLRAERVHLGEIPPERRRLFDVTAITRKRFPHADHLVVAHRIPHRLLADHAPEDVVELEHGDADFAMYRSLVQYAYPGRANGSVIYETPPSFNLPRPGRPPASTLTFTSKIVVGDDATTCLALMNYSLDPAYDVTARYDFAFFAPDGTRVTTGRKALPPFTVRALDARRSVPAAAAASYRDTRDGLSWFTYVGLCRDTAIIPLILTLSPERGAVAVEHTHPAQAYTLPARPQDKHRVKSRAVELWADLLASERLDAAP